ncbi:MAG: hypothetical protein ABIO35_08365 [Nitrobacter sp.]
MTRIDSIEDAIKGIVTYDLTDGKRISFDARVVEEYGAAELLRRSGHGHLLPTERVAVMWHGRKAGTMSPYFDPYTVKSKSPWYTPRREDFTRDGETWVASPTLGPGDLEAIPGFAWEPNHMSHR